MRANSNAQELWKLCFGEARGDAVAQAGAAGETDTVELATLAYQEEAEVCGGAGRALWLRHISEECQCCPDCYECPCSGCHSGVDSCDRAECTCGTDPYWEDDPYWRDLESGSDGWQVIDNNDDHSAASGQPESATADGPKNKQMSNTIGVCGSAGDRR